MNPNNLPIEEFLRKCEIQKLVYQFIIMSTGRMK